MNSLKPIGPSAWNLSAARHLLNRAGFGTPRALSEQLAGMDPEAAVDYLVNYELVAFDFPAPDFLVPAMTYKERNAQRKGLEEEERRKLRQKWQREERKAVTTLRGWWLQRMRTTPRPLEEKMTLFWHGHFATSAQKIKSSEHNYALNQIFRANATGNFKTLVTEVGQSPAMLRYLDNDRSTKKKPNENWARELMELFTLGQGQYTEDDIKQMARAFTGWASDGREFRFNVRNHDAGVKTVFGRSGNYDGWEAIEILFEQEALATFICGKLWRFFASEEADEAVIAGLAKTFRASNYDLAPVLYRLFRSEAFYADSVRATQIKSPAQLVVKLTHDLHLNTVPPIALAQAAASLGQNVLHPPNVKGWDGNRAWINANTLLLRYNLSTQLHQAAQRGHRQVMAGGGDPMMMAGTDSPMMMADSGKKAPPKDNEIRTQVRNKIKVLPKEERQAKLAILRKGNPAQKRALLKELGIKPPAEHNPLQALFEEMGFATAGECVTRTAAALVDVPISPEQRKTLLATLGTQEDNAPLTAAELPVAQQQQLLHLITSMAEYQLC
jgi:uncharacterized protein (DUF1800 family)